MKKIFLVLFILLSFPMGVFALTANAATSEADELGTVELVSMTSVNSTPMLLIQSAQKILLLPVSLTTAL